MPKYADVAAARTGKAHLKIDKIGAKVARAADRIREMIIQDELLPGSPIRERALAYRFEITRTPLREALKILSAEGLVELNPDRGAVVADPSDKEVTDTGEGSRPSTHWWSLPSKTECAGSSNPVNVQVVASSSFTGRTEERAFPVPANAVLHR